MKRAALLGAVSAASVADAKWFGGSSSSNEQKWAPARATASSLEAAGTLGWTPKPTPGPAEAVLRHELLKRSGTSTCGYFVGNTSPSAAIVCTSGSQCIVNDSNKAMGCCSSSNIQACNVATVCMDATDASSISTSTAPYTLLCQAATAPNCVTYSYATGSPYSGFQAFSCGWKKEVFTVAYTAPGAPSTGITSAAGATTTSAQNSIPEGGGNVPPITITSTTKSRSSGANHTSAGSPTTTSQATSTGSGGSTTSSAPPLTNDNSNNNTPTILAGVIGGVGGLVIILAGLLSSIFFVRKKKKDNEPKNRNHPVEKTKRPYMPAAFPNSFDYIAAYRQSRRQSARLPSGMSPARRSFVRSFGRRSSMLPFWRQSQPPQHQQHQNPQQPSFRQQDLSRRSEDRKIVNSSHFPMPPMPMPPRAVRDIRQQGFDFGTRGSPTFSVPVNRNARGVGPAPATPVSTLPLTRLESGSTSTLTHTNSMSVQTSPPHREGVAGTGAKAAGTGAGAGGGYNDDGAYETRSANSVHTDFDSRFTPPYISPPAGLRHRPSNENIGIATVLAPAPAGGRGAGRGGAAGAAGGRTVSTAGATAGSLSNHNSRAPLSPRVPRAQQYMLYNPQYGRPREVPVTRPVGHLDRML
ncbi:yip1 domain-containing protein [Apiospora phragmitis]|uniref:Yip1 domain-containing protein n=1 Tax=Apiospora phragmitis TaxID=2905665 RepID=A0ABR1T409_9PEZI